jgi:hypothetical protein
MAERTAWPVDAHHPIRLFSATPHGAPGHTSIVVAQPGTLSLDPPQGGRECRPILHTLSTQVQSTSGDDDAAYDLGTDGFAASHPK